MKPEPMSWSKDVIASHGLSPHVSAFTTTRWHGCSAPPFASFNLGDHVGDGPEQVLQNRQRLSALLPNPPCWLNQVHGVAVFDADTHVGAETNDASANKPTADAAVTCAPGRVLAVLTADCLPVVFSVDQHDVLGVAHAGWRGLADGVLLTTLAALRDRVKRPVNAAVNAAVTDAETGAVTIRAWIGPGIGPSAFQVGSEVRTRFVEMAAELHEYFQPDPQASGKWLADLAGMAAWQLQQHGVVVQNSGLCTVSDAQNRFFSYRREGQTGRMATLAWLDDSRNRLT